MTSSIYNFSAGPAALPKEVMLKAQQELLDWHGMGVSVMEISHRSSDYQELAAKAEKDLRQLLKIGDSHAVLFLHGGASHQFSNIPMAFLHSNQQAEYITNGMWSQKAAIEASRFGQVNQINALQINSDGTQHLIDSANWNRTEQPAYTHFTPNETIEGIRFDQIIKSEGPVIADMSSCILSENINVDQYDLIYAGAQKNIGPAGMTIVIVKKEFFSRMNKKNLPKVFDYEEQAKQGSMINTPPTYAWYLASLVFDWLIEQGGVAKMEELAIKKAELLYNCIDQDDFYHNPIFAKDRSRMNIPFLLKNEGLNESFLKLAKSAGLIGLKGHRSFGGMRASLYNSMSIDGVKALTQFMLEFKLANG